MTFSITCSYQDNCRFWDENNPYKCLSRKTCKATKDYLKNGKYKE